MSHPAIVAYENGDGTFDLHYSRNGAERYQLKQFLDGYLEGEYEKLGGKMPPLLPTEISEIMPDDMEINEYDLIEADPITESVEPEDIPQNIPDITAEVLYVVRDWQVDTFSIVPITPSLAPVLAEHIELEIYDCQDLGIAPEPAIVEENEPTLSMSNWDFFDPSKFEEMSDPVYSAFSQYHLDFLDGILHCAHQQRDDEDEPSTFVIFHRDCIMAFEVRNPTPMPWSPIFVEVWPGKEREPTYPWPYDQRNPNPRSFSNDIRLELSLMSVQELADVVRSVRIEPRTGYLNDKHWETQTREFTRFIMTLLEKYGVEYSEEFSDTGLLDEILVDSLSGDSFRFGDSIEYVTPDSA